MIITYLILTLLWTYFSWYKVNQYKTARWYHKAITLILNFILFPIAFVWALCTGRFTTQAEGEEDYSGENERWFQLNELTIIRRTDGSPYLIRRTFLGMGQYFSIKYHQILLSDESCQHDHPWGFWSFMMKGGYYEWTPESQEEKGEILDERIGMDGIKEVKRWHGEGSFNYRPAKWRHSLELKMSEPLFQVREDDGNMFIREIPSKLITAHTLVLTLNVVRDWGFFTKNGWMFWKNYSKEKHC